MLQVAYSMSSIDTPIEFHEFMIDTRVGSLPKVYICMKPLSCRIHAFRITKSSIVQIVHS